MIFLDVFDVYYHVSVFVVIRQLFYSHPVLLERTDTYVQFMNVPRRDGYVGDEKPEQVEHFLFSLSGLLDDQILMRTTIRTEPMRSGLVSIQTISSSWMMCWIVRAEASVTALLHTIHQIQDTIHLIMTTWLLLPLHPCGYAWAESRGHRGAPTWQAAPCSDWQPQE